MGTNEDSAAAPKVPPLKIVLSSNHNNTIVTNSTNDETQSSEQSSSFNSNETNDNSSDHIVEQKEVKCELEDDKSDEKSMQKKITKEERDEFQLLFGTSSSTSSDSSNSTTPSSDPESVASNSTIISDQQAKNKNDDVKQDKNPKSNAKQSNNNNKKPDSNLEQASESTNSNTSKEQQNYRITRSSQRAAQQNKTENQQADSNQVEEPIIDNQDKLQESARKAKRKKGEVQEVVEQDSVVTTEQSTINFADIYPADYQLPSQNSFQLYRDIRRRPHKKLLKLDYIRPKVPHGFKDYLINGGPYLLDGNKLGVGVNGARLRNLYKSEQEKNGISGAPINRSPRKKLTNLHHKWSMYQPSQQRHNSYVIPKLLDAPKNLQVGSPLYELFLDQERIRHQMKIQHLKERERSILTAEQEILRAYNKAAIAGVRQKLHLSACTYFYYQERYHYIDDKKDKKSTNELSDSDNTRNKDNDNNIDIKTPPDDSFLCSEGKEAMEVPPLNEDEESNDAFLAQLQEIDEKWSKIMKDMLTRHKNEADSLYAVQSLEWEWKAKEIGSCDVRISLKIESEMVPRIEIAPLDY